MNLEEMREKIRHDIYRDQLLRLCPHCGAIDENSCPKCGARANHMWIDGRLRSEIEPFDLVEKACPVCYPRGEHTGQIIIRTRAGVREVIGGLFESSSSPGTQGTIA